MNAKGKPDDAILVSFDIANMFPSIENKRGVDAVKHTLDSQTSITPSTKCITEGLEIRLTNNNSIFAGQNFIQPNGTAKGAANSCSYSGLVIQSIDNAVIDIERTIF